MYLSIMNYELVKMTKTNLRYVQTRPLSFNQSIKAIITNDISGPLNVIVNS